MGGRGVLLLLVGAAIINVCLAQTSAPSICPAVVNCYTNSIVQAGCINNASNIVGYAQTPPSTGYSNNPCANSPCLHGGSCVPSATNNSYTCNCAPMFVGSQCQTFWCDYAQQQNYNSQGYSIPGWSGKIGYCDNSSGTTYLVIQRRQDGSVNFMRNWTQYEQGFGNSYGEFWFGNWYLAQLSTQTWWLLRFDIWDWSGDYGWAQYGNFSIAGATLNYALQNYLGAVTGNATDCFTYNDGGWYGGSQNNGQEFSTYDQDHDTHPTANCAALENGGWWYSQCGYSNPNGLYNNTNWQSQYALAGVVWYRWKNNYSFKKIEMKIRPTI